MRAKAWWVAYLLLAVPVGSSGQDPASNAVIKRCELPQQEKWSFALNSLGVLGSDPVGHQIPSFAARKWATANWYPLSATKEVMCGKLSDYGWFYGLDR